MVLEDEQCPKHGRHCDHWNGVWESRVPYALTTLQLTTNHAFDDRHDDSEGGSREVICRGLVTEPPTLISMEIPQSLAPKGPIRGSDSLNKEIATSLTIRVRNCNIPELLVLGIQCESHSGIAPTPHWNN